MSSTNFAISGTSNSSHPAYYAFNETYGNQNCWIPTSSDKTLKIYNPLPINITKLTIQNRTSGTQDKRVWTSGSVYVDSTLLTEFTNTDYLAFGNIWDIIFTNTLFSNNYSFVGGESTYTSDKLGAIEQMTLTATCKI